MSSYEEAHGYGESDLCEPLTRDEEEALAELVAIEVQRGRYCTMLDYPKLGCPGCDYCLGSH